MTVNISNTELTHTFEYWRTRTNEMADTITVKAVTVNSNAAVGNAFVDGTFRANTLMTTTLSGGTVGAVANLTISTNTAFQANVSVTGAASLANTLAVTGAATLSNTLAVTGNITANAAASVNTSLTVGNSTVNTFISTGNITTNTSITVGNSTVNTYANSTYVKTATANVTSNLIVGNSTVNTVITTGNVVTTHNFVGNNATLTTQVAVGATTRLNAANVITANVYAVSANISNTAAITGVATFANTVAITGATTLSNTVAVTGDVTASANVQVNSRLSVGNSTVNTFIASGSVTTNTSITVGNSTVNTYANSTFLETANVTVDSTLKIGLSTVNAPNTVISVGNVVTSHNLSGNNALATTMVRVGPAAGINVAITTAAITATSTDLAIKDITSANVVANKITVGNTVINGANITANNYYGRWAGQPIPIEGGGTGIGYAPTAGQLLIGNTGGAFHANGVANGKGVIVTNGEGSIKIEANVASITTGNNIRVTSNNTSGVYTIHNSGVWSFASNSTNARTNTDIMLLGTDVAQALGYIPASSNSNLWMPANTDTYYDVGNVAIGFFVANAAATPWSANSTLDVRTYYNANNKFVIRAENGNMATAECIAAIDLKVSNNGSRSVLSFSRGTLETDWTKGKVQYNHSNDSLSIFTNSAERVTILGNAIGIGNTFPQPNESGEGLHVTGTNPGITLHSTTTTGSFILGANPWMNYIGGGSRPTNTFAIYNDTANTGLLWENTNNSATATFKIVNNGLNRMHFAANGFVGIGNSAPVQMLHVQGDVMSTGYQTLSDIRAKENIRPIENAWERVKLLEPCMYDYIDGKKDQEGFLAHKLQPVVPSAVVGSPDDAAMQTVDKTNTIALLTEALKQALNRIEELEQKIQG